MSLRDKTFENLDNALTGGYIEILTMPTVDLVQDLQNYASDMEGEDTCQLMQIVDQYPPRVSALRQRSGVASLDTGQDI